MTQMTHRARRVKTPSLLLAAWLVVAACSLKDQLLEPQQPGTIGPESVSDPIGADALVVGALQSFQSNTGGGTTMWSAGGTLADEAMLVAAYAARRAPDG